VASDCFHSNSEARAIASLTNPAINCELRRHAPEKNQVVRILAPVRPQFFPRNMRARDQRLNASEPAEFIAQPGIFFCLRALQDFPALQAIGDKQ